MKKIFIPLMTVAVVVTLLLVGCVPEAAPPVTPPPVTPPPVTPPPVTPPPVTPPAPAPTTVADIPELQGLVASGAIDPDLLMNPYEGLAIKPDGTPYKIASAQMSLGNEFWTDGAGMLQSLIKRAGGEFTSYSAEFDVALQVSWIEDQLATVHPDGIILDACDEAGLAPAVTKAMGAGIPVVSWDVVAYESVSIVYHDMTGPAGTTLCGQYFVDWAERTGEELHIMQLWCPRSFTTCRERSIGLHSVVDECPLITVMESIDTPCTPEAMFSIIEDKFTAYPELNAIFSMTGGGDGAIEALRVLGRLFPVGHPDHVPFVAETSSPLFEMLLMGDESSVDAIFTHHSWDLVDVAVKCMFTHLILGQPVPYDLPTPMILVTPENVNTAESMMYGVPAICSAMPREQFDLWPVMDTSELGIETPTKAMRMELLGY